MEIGFITYDQVLSISKVRDVQSTTKSNGVSTTISGDLNVVRSRAIHAYVKLLYKGRPFKDISSWCALEPALEEAERIARHYEVNAVSEAEVVVLATIDDISYVAVMPDNFDFRSIRVKSRHQMEQALREIDGHQIVKQMENVVVWSTRHTTEAESLSLARRLMAEGRHPHECLKEVGSLFNESH